MQSLVQSILNSRTVSEDIPKPPSHIQNSRHNSAKNSGYSSGVTQVCGQLRRVLTSLDGRRSLCFRKSWSSTTIEPIIQLSWRRDTIMTVTTASRQSYDCHDSVTTKLIVHHDWANNSDGSEYCITMDQRMRHVTICTLFI